MDYDKLIHCLKCCARVDAQNEGCDDCDLEYCGEECQQLCGTAATALSTLRAENEKLRVEAEGMRSNWYKSVEEIKKLRAEVESLKKGHCAGCSIPAVKAEQIRDLTDAPKLRAELEQVKRERDAAVSWAQKYTESIDRPCVACKHNTGDYVCTAICGNCGPMGTESCKWEFDFSGELKEG